MGGTGIVVGVVAVAVDVVRTVSVRFLPISIALVRVKFL